MAALQDIEKAINEHPTTGGAKRLVRFLAEVYNGQDYPFDLTELRGLDTILANDCLFLNRLGRCARTLRYQFVPSPHCCVLIRQRNIDRLRGEINRHQRGDIGD